MTQSSRRSKKTKPYWPDEFDPVQRELDALRQSHALEPAMQRILLIGLLTRYETALAKLGEVLQRNERAQGIAKLSFQRAWQEGVEGTGGFNELGNWLDEEIDARTPFVPMAEKTEG